MRHAYKKDKTRLIILKRTVAFKRQLDTNICPIILLFSLLSPQHGLFWASTNNFNSLYLIQEDLQHPAVEQPPTKHSRYQSTLRSWNSAN